MKRILLACAAGLGLVSTAVAGDLPKVEGSWPVHVLERNLAEMSFYEDSSRLSCLSRYHCTRLFFEDEVGTRVDIAVKAGRVYRLCASALIEYPTTVATEACYSTSCTRRRALGGFPSGNEPR